MSRRLWRLYQRHRIINVNLNIIGAGLLAVAISKLPVLYITDLIGPDHKLINALVAAVIDGIVDILLYFALHWIANHWRPLKPQRDEDAPEEHAAFWRNATLVQFERLTLTPVFYVFAIGGTWGLQYLDISASWAFVISFSVGLVVTRVVHTAWALKTGRFGPLPALNGKRTAQPRVPTTTDAA
jgi:hypothetical protein